MVTPSIVNLILALRQLSDHFGPGFLISLVLEGTQISGYPSYVAASSSSHLRHHVRNP